jgi:hypothetical protein
MGRGVKHTGRFSRSVQGRIYSGPEHEFRLARSYRVANASISACMLALYSSDQ